MGSLRRKLENDVISGGAVGALISVQFRIYEQIISDEAIVSIGSEIDNIVPVGMYEK